jgi:hypothetical protein
MGFSLLSQGGTREQPWTDLKKEHWVSNMSEQITRAGFVLANSGLYMRKTLIAAGVHTQALVGRNSFGDSLP